MGEFGGFIDRGQIPGELTLSVHILNQSVTSTLRP